ADAVSVRARLYENLTDTDKELFGEDGSININPASLTVCDPCYVEPALAEAEPYDRFQFVRNGFFVADPKDSKPGVPVFNRIVSLKSSFKLPKEQ
ncbi:MAG: glutamine--tRNA ligase, partial [Lachnospiraceae bacterium]|nr:glutamine--tRNA ligase [Lachnospiraceae bacterium]